MLDFSNGHCFFLRRHIRLIFWPFWKKIYLYTIYICDIPGIYMMLHAQYNTPLNMAAMPFCRMDQFPKMQMQASLPSQMYSPHAFEGILELRKEKSRDAARSRRGKENYEFYELAKMLPLPGAITSQLDKASIIRLTISFLKLRDFSGHGDPPWQRDVTGISKSGKGTNNRRRNMSSSLAVDIFETHQGTHILQSLDGFVFALSNDGRFLYISETVSIYLGLSQVEMTGSSIFDYVHTSDHQEMAEQLGINSQGIYSSTSSSGGSDEGGNSNSNTSRAVTPTLPERTSIMNPNPSKGYDRCFCVRMKSTLTKRGVHVKSSGYRVVQILAHMRPQFSFSLTRKHPPPLLGLVAMAIALPPPTMTELVIDNDMFVTRLSPELKVTYCEARIADMMDISADDLTNKNLYDYCHAEDLQKLRRAHIDLLGKGQVLTDYYRLMNKHGGFVWLQTCATIICNAKNADEQNIIAINYVLSGVEYAGCVMNTNQLKVVSKTEPDQSDHSENEHSLERDEKHGKDEKMSSRRERQNGDDRGHRGNKRKHSTAHDNRSNLSEMTAAEQHSPPLNSFDLLYQKHKNLAKETDPGMNGVVLHTDSLTSLDKHNKSIDMKNSRRKMEKPRKRKRDQNDPDPDGKVDLSLNAVDGSNDFDLTASLNPPDVGPLSPPDNSVLGAVSGMASRPASSHSIVNPTSPIVSSSDHGTRICRISPTPEDLSVRNSQSPLVALSPKPRSITPVVDHGIPLDTTTATPPVVSTTEANLQHAWPTDPVSSAVPLPQTETNLSEIATSCGNSVRDLEEAMNKHLPSLPGETDHIRASLAAAADYSQSMLGLHQKHKSTIQWIGSQGHASSDSTLPATNLLRSLYVNRESVIRTNIYNPRPQYYGSEMQNSLLTPPGGSSDPYKENFTSPTLNQSKTSPSSSTNYPGLISSYSTSPISVTMATTNMTDAYAMTPPSSVSPQEKYASPFTEQFHGEMGMSALRGYGTHDGSLTMPIKPQAYPLPAHANTHVGNYDRSSQYSTPPGYYGATFTPYNHTASPAPAHYRDTRASNVW